MKSTFDILSTLYQVLNPIASPLINGGVYIGDEPERSQKENISLNLIANPIGYVQSATGNVNIHVLGIHEKGANLKRIKEIVDVILPELNDKVHRVGGTTLHVTIEDDKGVFSDNDNQGKFYYNIRVNLITL